MRQRRLRPGSRYLPLGRNPSCYDGSLWSLCPQPWKSTRQTGLDCLCGEALFGITITCHLYFNTFLSEKRQILPWIQTPNVHFASVNITDHWKRSRVISLERNVLLQHDRNWWWATNLMGRSWHRVTCLSWRTEVKPTWLNGPRCLLPPGCL